MSICGCLNYSFLYLFIYLFIHLWIYVFITMKRYHDQSNLQKKAFKQGLLTVSEGKTMTIMMGSMKADRQAQCWGNS